MSSLVNQWAVDELIDRCSRRPADEAAWQEFVRRFHPSIRDSVASVFARLMGSENGTKHGSVEDTLHDLVQGVYRRLTENESAALKRANCTQSGSMKNYLLLITINVVRDYFRRGIAPGERTRSSGLLGSDEFLSANAFAAVKVT